MAAEGVVHSCTFVNGHYLIYISYMHNVSCIIRLYTVSAKGKGLRRLIVSQMPINLRNHTKCPVKVNPYTAGFQAHSYHSTAVAMVTLQRPLD